MTLKPPQPCTEPHILARPRNSLPEPGNWHVGCLHQILASCGTCNGACSGNAQDASVICPSNSQTSFHCNAQSADIRASMLASILMLRSPCPLHVCNNLQTHPEACDDVERTSSLSPKASSAVTVQSRYSWMVAILGASTRDVFRPRGGRVCMQGQCIRT